MNSGNLPTRFHRDFKQAHRSWRTSFPFFIPQALPEKKYPAMRSRLKTRYTENEKADNKKN